MPRFANAERRNRGMKLRPKNIGYVGVAMTIEPKNETELVQITLAQLWNTYPRGLFYRRNTGAMNDGKQMIRFGLPGMADIGGIIDSRAVEIELKFGKGKQSEAQKNWEQAVRKAGGIYIIAYTVEEVLMKVSAAIKIFRHVEKDIDFDA